MQKNAPLLLLQPTRPPATILELALAFTYLRRKPRLSGHGAHSFLGLKEYTFRKEKTSAFQERET